MGKKSKKGKPRGRQTKQNAAGRGGVQRNKSGMSADSSNVRATLNGDDNPQVKITAAMLENATSTPRIISVNPNGQDASDEALRNKILQKLMIDVERMKREEEMAKALSAAKEEQEKNTASKETEASKEPGKTKIRNSEPPALEKLPEPDSTEKDTEAKVEEGKQQDEKHVMEEQQKAVSEPPMIKAQDQTTEVQETNIIADRPATGVPDEAPGGAEEPETLQSDAQNESSDAVKESQQSFEIAQPEVPDETPAVEEEPTLVNESAQPKVSRETSEAEEEMQPAPGVSECKTTKKTSETENEQKQMSEVSQNKAPEETPLAEKEVQPESFSLDETSVVKDEPNITTEGKESKLDVQPTENKADTEIVTPTSEEPKSATEVSSAGETPVIEDTTKAATEILEPETTKEAPEREGPQPISEQEENPKSEQQEAALKEEAPDQTSDHTPPVFDRNGNTEPKVPDGTADIQEDEKPAQNPTDEVGESKSVSESPEHDEAQEIETPTVDEPKSVSEVVSPDETPEIEEILTADPEILEPETAKGTPEGEERANLTSEPVQEENLTSEQPEAIFKEAAPDQASHQTPQAPEPKAIMEPTMPDNAAEVKEDPKQAPDASDEVKESKLVSESPGHEEAEESKTQTSEQPKSIFVVPSPEETSEVEDALKAASESLEPAALKETPEREEGPKPISEPVHETVEVEEEHPKLLRNPSAEVKGSKAVSESAAHEEVKESETPTLKQPKSVSEASSPDETPEVEDTSKAAPDSLEPETTKETRERDEGPKQISESVLEAPAEPVHATPEEAEESGKSEEPQPEAASKKEAVDQTSDHASPVEEPKPILEPKVPNETANMGEDPKLAQYRTPDVKESIVAPESPENEAAQEFQVSSLEEPKSVYHTSTPDETPQIEDSSKAAPELFEPETVKETSGREESTIPISEPVHEAKAESEGSLASKEPKSETAFKEGAPVHTSDHTLLAEEPKSIQKEPDQNADKREDPKLDFVSPEHDTLNNDETPEEVPKLGSEALQQEALHTTSEMVEKIKFAADEPGTEVPYDAPGSDHATKSDPKSQENIAPYETPTVEKPKPVNTPANGETIEKAGGSPEEPKATPTDAPKDESIEEGSTKLIEEDSIQHRKPSKPDSNMASLGVDVSTPQLVPDTLVASKTRQTAKSSEVNKATSIPFSAENNNVKPGGEESQKPASIPKTINKTVVDEEEPSEASVQDFAQKLVSSSSATAAAKSRTVESFDEPALEERGVSQKDCDCQCTIM